ncbi:MAG: ATP-binding protein [Chryseolinea sp.]
MIIIICGLQDSGKSDFAAKLSNKFDFPLISSERLRARLQALGKYRLKDKLFIYEKMARLAQQNLKSNKGVIIDAPFSQQASRDPFIKLADTLSVPIRWIFVNTSEDIFKDRLITSGSSETAFKVIKTMRDEFEPFVGRVLKLDSTDTNIDKMIKAVERFIKQD